MMGGNPNNNWWNMNHHNSYVLGSSIPFNSLTENPPPPTNSSSWSQLLFSGVPGEEERLGFDHFQVNKKLGSWDEQILNGHDHEDHEDHDVVDIGIIKQEVSSRSGNLYGHHGGSSTTEEFLQATSSSGSANWSHMVAMAISSSPSSCVTTLSNNNNNNINILDFTYNKPDHHHRKINNQPSADHTSSECNSTSSGGVCKKARVHSSPSQPPLKVRKEKLGDRITALHQLVSPFGKTDTASVLLEAIGYIRFLQAQIQALSSPYLGNSSRNRRNQQSVNVHGERNSVFPEDPGQLLNDSGLHKRTNIASPNQQDVAEEKAKDLRSRGLCLVPVSFTQHVGSENGADYWSSAYGTGF